MNARLKQEAIDALDLSLDDRIAYIRKKKWYGYTAAQEIIDELNDLLLYPKCDRMPNLLIAGNTNSGKTTIVKRFLASHPAYDEPDSDSVVIPVLFMQAPPVADEGRFYDEILDLLFAPTNSTAKISKKEKEVLRLLDLIGTRMLVIDEIHNILAGTMSRQQSFLNAVKNLGNNLKIPIVGIGTEEAFRAIHSDEQISNRFRRTYLEKWKLDSEYLRLLASFEYTLPLKEPSNLSELSFAKDLLYMSEGSLGELSAIIELAAVYALRNSKEKITKETLTKIKWILPSKRSSIKL